MKVATELEWLRYFYNMVDIGTHSRLTIYHLQKEFTEKLGKLVPEGYRYEDE